MARKRKKFGKKQTSLGGMENRVKVQDADSELIISWLQAAVILVIGLVYFLAPKPVDTGSLSPVSVVLMMVAPTIILRLILSRQRSLDKLLVHFFILVDVAFLIALITSYSFQYNESVTLSLKAPTFVYFFILLALRSLRFEKQYVIATGVWIVIGWSFLTYYGIRSGLPVTRSYVEYHKNLGILIGAEIDKMMIIVFVTAILAIGVARTKKLLLRSVEEVSSTNQRLLEKNRQLQKAQKIADAALATREQFLSVMSHELRTPLNAVIGLAELIRDDCLDKKEVEMSLDAANIKVSGERLLFLIERLFTLTSDHDIAPPLLCSVTLERLKVRIEDIFNNLFITVENFSVEDRTGLLSIVTDIRIIQKICFELISNAVQFNAELGRVSVVIERKLEDSRSCLLINVVDQGVGVPDGELEKIFNPFYQVEHFASRKVSGAGVGLSISRKLARSIGAKIRCHSILGQGSRFTLSIPLNEVMETDEDTLTLVDKTG